MNLLQRLNELQARDGWLSQEALRELSAGGGDPPLPAAGGRDLLPALPAPAAAPRHGARLSGRGLPLDGSATYLKAVREALAG